MNIALFCLHGWGGSKESWNELREVLAHTSNITLFTPDLPGFGEEPEPQKPWTVDHYAGWCQGWMKGMLESEKEMGRTYDAIWLIGHSHGGRTALKMAYYQSNTEKEKRMEPEIDRLFLCAAAGIQKKKGFKEIIGLIVAKSGKWLLSCPGCKWLTPITKKLLYKLMRVHDYERASDVMRRTLINVTNEDLTPLLHTITIPTHIFWGESDTMTPVKDAYTIHNAIQGSVLYTYPGIRHAVHREKAAEIAQYITKFL